MNTAETDNKYEKLLNPDELWALVDCNNFYASCEELFRPDLKDKPIVVLSNNDGCIVARSQKAKELGIPMGEPEFKIRSFLKLHNVAVFSSNYALYGDISTRVMHIIDEICPCEPYSIDEAFCRLKKSLAPNCLEIAKLLRERIQKWTGITCSVGIAPSKTLAKLANHIAKKENGIFILDPAQENFNELLKKIPVREIWGVGKKQSEKLRTNSIRTAYDYKSASEEWIQKKFNRYRIENPARTARCSVYRNRFFRYAQKPCLFTLFRCTHSKLRGAFGSRFLIYGARCGTVTPQKSSRIRNVRPYTHVFPCAKLLQKYGKRPFPLSSLRYEDHAPHSEKAFGRNVQKKPRLCESRHHVLRHFACAQHSKKRVFPAQ